MNYEEFLQLKKINPVITGHNVDIGAINPVLFDFQNLIVRWGTKRGRAAIFGDTGNGKTPMQVEWAKQVASHTGGQVMIAAPLAVAQQTVEMASDLLGVRIGYARNPAQIKEQITITNYEMLQEFDLSEFSGLVLDESSILKSQTGATRTAIIELAQPIPYRLALSATPSPNDYMELGNHAEFLGIMSMQEMLATFFVHDGSDTSNWILKGHGKRKFWEWLATWAVCFRNPSDLGFDGSKYILPPLNIHTVIVPSESKDQLFPEMAAGLLGRNVARKESMGARIEEAQKIANSLDEPCVVWCLRNDENDTLKTAITDAVAIEGKDSIEYKERAIHGFSHGEYKKLISKTSITGYGLNWQHCRKTIFAAINDSFEAFYQAIKRFHRFGQTEPVDAWVIFSEAERATWENIQRKWAQHEQMQKEMVEHMSEFMKHEIFGATQEKADYVRDVVKTADYEIHLADCVDLASEIETGSIDYTIFSPPFSSLYTYSNSDRDMGNCKNDGEFYQHFRFLVDEMLRITRPGRLLSFHCMNLPTSKQNDGFIGIKDFRGELIKMFTDAGWIYHSEVCIWKDPVTAMQRTKALGLLHKTIRKDSSMSRQGIADYLVTMRKPGLNDKPVRHYRDERELHEVCAAEGANPIDEEINILPVELWQKYASPVWMDINPSRTLNYREGRDEDDERHICPLQLDVIERAMHLWTAPDDLVFSPFTGIGSEGYTAVKMGRRFIGSELKRSYWELAKRNIDEAKVMTMDLFAA